MQRGAVATAPEGMQNLELLPNATGVACQTVSVEAGAKYKLSFYYGRLETYAWRNEYKGQFVKFETSMDAVARDGGSPAPAEINFSQGGVYPQEGMKGPSDRQGFTVGLCRRRRGAGEGVPFAGGEALPGGGVRRLKQAAARRGVGRGCLVLSANAPPPAIAARPAGAGDGGHPQAVQPVAEVRGVRHGERCPWIIHPAARPG
jgi:hypothetical protein